MVSASLAFRTWIIYSRSKVAAIWLLLGLVCQFGFAMTTIAKQQKYSHVYGGTCALNFDDTAPFELEWYEKFGIWVSTAS